MKLPEGIDMTPNGNEKEGLKKLNIQVETEVDPQLLRHNLDEVQQQLIQTYILINFTVASIPLKTFIMNFEKHLIDFSLSVSRGSQKRAAHLLGIKETTLSEKIRKYQIKKSDKMEDINILELESFSRLASHLLG